MSNVSEAQGWLSSFHSSDLEPKDLPLDRHAKVIAVTGGKGGVGKTSTALKMCKILSKKSQKVLLIDLDHNLSNTKIKLGLDINDDFFDLISARKTFKECIYTDGNFHLLPGCNGSLDLLDKEFNLYDFLRDIIEAHKAEYDYIFVDCPAGISHATLKMCAYSDKRIFTVVPEKSSITDAYSLIKILKNRYNISNNFFLVNKVESRKQLQRVVNSIVDTTRSFLQANSSYLGHIRLAEGKIDQFDKLLAEENCSLHQDFCKVVDSFTEKLDGTLVSMKEMSVAIEQ